ncbi:MAG: fibronectin type III domain-containing protein, partial [Thermoguttaceae bacterium]|nr:fibronectin type III domain-containing protein [Thermoguttaceae bacterium]
VTVAWNHVANASGYVVEYKSANDASYTVMPITNDATVTITNLAHETTYKLRLYAVGDAINYANSPYSSVKAVKTKVAPVVPDDAVPLDVPTWKSSSSTASSVTVAWSPVANASGYVVEYKSASDASYTVMPITNDATITITNLAPETTYKLRLYAVGDAIDYANSPYSSVKAVKTKVAPVAPAPLTAPTFASTSSTANSVTIAWRPVANASGYVVEYKGPADPAFVAIPQTTATTATIDNLVADSAYEVRVYAVGDGAFYSNSDPSAVEAVRTLAASADVPSTVVTSLADTVDANDGLITLREAITVYANEGDAVTFAPTLKGGTIALSGSQIVIDKAITVSARALWDKTDGVPGITIDANSASRIFRITGDTVWLDSLAFTGGNGGGAGGAIYAYQSTLTISNAAFSCNTGTYGGAVYADASTLAISNSSFRNNTVEGEGGGAAINAYRSTLAVANSSFRDNTAYYGGAIYASYSTATISNASFWNNAASGLGGGAIGAQISTLDVSNSSFQNNTGTFGGAFDVSSSALTLSNSILVQNAALNASALYLASANARVFNATIYGNVASGAGSNRAIYASANTHLDLHNSIVAGNSGADVYKADVRSVVSAYNVLSGYAGWTNADAIVFAYDPSKPLFADAAQGDYALARGSQAIDKGDDVYVYAEKDLAGNARINFEAVDLGAYEYGTMLEAPKIKSSSATRSSITVAWNAVANAAGYVVAYKSSADSSYIETPVTRGTTYTLVNLAPATEYKVKVLAKGDGTNYSDSPYSAVKAVKTLAPPASALLDDAFAEFDDDSLFDEF